MKPRQEAAASRAPGCFRKNGSWDLEGTPGPESALHAGVVGLARTRYNHPDLLPCDFVPIVLANHFESAFPNLRQWEECRNWLGARASSSAERLVQTAGGDRVPNPTGEIPPVTPEIAQVLESITRRPVEITRCR